MECLKVSLLMIGVLSLLSNIAKCSDDGRLNSLELGVNETDVTSTFLNFGQKTNGSQRYWYEHLEDAERMLRSKADILSRLLKMHIDRLRRKTDQVDKYEICIFSPGTS